MKCWFKLSEDTLFWFKWLAVVAIRIRFYRSSSKRQYLSRAWQNHQHDCAPSEYSDQTGHPPSLIRVRCPHEESLGPWLPIERTAKTLIRRGCPGWSESSLGAVILLVLSWGGSFWVVQVKKSRGRKMCESRYRKVWIVPKICRHSKQIFISLC